MSISNKNRRHIFALSKELGLDDESRQHMQQNVVGKSSTTQMDDRDAGRLIAHMQRLAGPQKRIPNRAGRAPSNLDRKPYLQKIEAMLAEMSLSWQYAESIAWRVTGGRGTRPDSQPGVRRMEWVQKAKHFDAIIAALYVEQKKFYGLSNVNQLLISLGKDTAWLEAEIDLPKKWQRSVKYLGAALDYLSELVDE